MAVLQPAVLVIVAVLPIGRDVRSATEISVLRWRKDRVQAHSLRAFQVLRPSVIHVILPSFQRKGAILGGISCLPGPNFGTADTTVTTGRASSGKSA